MKYLSRASLRSWLGGLCTTLLLLAFALPMAMALLPDDDCCSTEVDCCDFDSCRCACHAVTGLIPDIRVLSEFAHSTTLEQSVPLCPAEAPRAGAYHPPRFSA